MFKYFLVKNNQTNLNPSADMTILLILNFPLYTFSRGQHPEVTGVPERRARCAGLREEAQTERETVQGGDSTVTNTQTTSSSKNIQFVLMICTKNKEKSTQKETLVLDELCVDSMLSMGLPKTITVIMNTFTPAFKPHTINISVCFLMLCLISARDKYDIT